MTNGGLAGGHSLAHLRRWWVGGLFTHSALNLPLHPTSASAVQCKINKNVLANVAGKISKLMCYSQTRQTECNSMVGKVVKLFAGSIWIQTSEQRWLSHLEYWRGLVRGRPGTSLWVHRRPIKQWSTPGWTRIWTAVPIRPLYRVIPENSAFWAGQWDC